MEIRNRGKRRCQFKDGDSILHNDRISGDNNPRSGGDVKVQINTYGEHFCIKRSEKFLL